MAPLPARPKPTPTTEHTELRPLGKPIARHVDRGFETLVVSTGEDMRCEGERLESGADVRIQGASDPRRPWSAWFSSLPVGGADNNGAGGNGGFLVIRRPLPARGEHQIAHVYLPAVCNGAPEHFRFALPDAESHAADPARAARTGPTVSPTTSRAAPGASSRRRASASFIPSPRRRRSPTRPIRATPDTERSSRRPPRRQRQQAEAGQVNSGRNGARRAARDRAAARPVRAGAPDGHHDRDDVAAGDAADRSGAARRGGRTRDGARCRS